MLSLHPQTTPVEAVQALVDAGASCLVQNRLTGATPLHMVAQSHKGTLSRRFETAEILLQAKADPSQTDHYGKLPVDCLTTPTSEEEVDLYTQMHEKLQPNPPGIFDAIVDCNLEHVKRLIQQEDVSTIHFQGKTPLSLAVQKLLQLMNDPIDSIDSQQMLVDIIQTLVSAGASTATSTQDEETPLHLLLTQLQTYYQQQEFCDQNAGETLRQSTHLLEEAILSFNANSFPADVLQQAARRDQVLFLQFLIEQRQLDPNQKGRQGMTALQFAARSGKLNSLVSRADSVVVHSLSLSLRVNSVYADASCHE